MFRLTFDKYKPIETYNNIKYEFDHKKRLSKELFVDCNATKEMSDKMTLKLNKNFNGIVQAIYHKPFGLLLFSEIQVINYF